MHKKIMKECASKLSKDSKNYEKKAEAAKNPSVKKENLQDKKAAMKASKYLRKK